MKTPFLSSFAFAAATMLSVSAALPELFAQDAQLPSISPLRSFVVKDASLTPPPGARQSNSSKWDSRSDDGSSYRYAEVIYVSPGALEPGGDAQKFHFAFDEPLNMAYEAGSLGFSGRSDSLFWQPQRGWGSEDVNLDMIPVLVCSDYEDLQEPSYEFVWQHNTNVPFQGDSIYLNYMFKIPKQSRLAGHAELNVKRQYFDRSFSTEAPHVDGSRIFIWDSGSLVSYDDDLGIRSAAQGWESLPSDFQATGIALSPDGSLLAMASPNRSVSCFSKQDASKPKWTVKGCAPMTADKDFLYAVSEDYSSLMVVRLSDGSAALACPLPRNMPRRVNSLATARLNETLCLFLFVPWQSKTMVFQVKGR